MISSAVVAQPSGCSGNDPGGQPAANGLYAEYYPGYFDPNQTFFTTNTAPPLLHRIEPQVNFATNTDFGDLTGIATGPVADPDNFSVRLRGSINIPTTGEYTFYLTSDDAAYLWLDGAAVTLPAVTIESTINNGGYHAPLEVAQTLMLPAGLHSLLIHYAEATGDNILVLEYSGPGIPRQVVPSGMFCTASQAPRPPQGITYSPAVINAFVGNVTQSAAPVVADGGSAVTHYAFATPVPLGLSIHPNTGILTVGINVPLGTYDLDIAVTNANGVSTFHNAASVVVVAGPPPGCTGTDPAGNGATSGLYAQYYAGYFNDVLTFFSGAAGITRIDPVVNFDAPDSFGDLTAVAGGTLENPNNFSAQYRGSLRIATSGTYTFFLTSDDASFLWLDNPALNSPLNISDAAINNGGLHAPQTRQVTLYMAAGLHNVRLLYGEQDGGRTMVFEYQGPGITRQVVPTGLLCSGIQPAQAVVSSLEYSPQMVARVVGTTGSSPLPVVASPTAVAQYVIANTTPLPAGITIHPTQGQISADATVPLGTYIVDVAVTNADGTAIFLDAFTFEVAPPPPTGCNLSAPNGSPSTAGLYGEYYTGYFNDVPSFFDTNTPFITRLEPGLNYDSEDGWGNILPPADNTLMDPDHYSARYRGSLQVATAGDYTFYLTSDDASYLWIDNAARVSPPRLNQALVDNGGLHGAITKSATITLTAGLHDMLIHFGEDTGNNRLVFEYEGPGVPRQIVPGSTTCSAATGAPLPVKLVRFEAKPTGTYVNVEWATAQERNSDYFEVERSTNGVLYEVVERREAAGNTDKLQRYQLTDRAPLPGVSYYRLHQVDEDGRDAYSPVVVVRVAQPSTLSAAVFPNPNKGSFSVRVQQTAAQPAQLELLNMQGQTVYRRALPAAAIGEYDLRLPQLAVGLYQLRLTSVAGIVTQKVVVE
ncbi:PA14 domain-containing protein [Hymenobacter lucidus]|uniref:T9SS type A sorting domain-containing protein n=1 Tax=Hymenobacter lucidus TaxID=2880930 RepID=A0ABS8AVP9_9BACT|nr:PA14 domain-containing protein [Hymenobacter lucidus]MCB2409292.1 T9SS type A sorting domain-containing protein [Hymenobacter lucidus]